MTGQQSTLPAEALRKGHIRAYNSGTHKADVQLVASMPRLLPDVRVGTHILAGACIVGRECTVLFFDATNPADAVVMAIQGALPPAGSGMAQHANEYHTPDMVSTTGNQTIAGIKTLTSIPLLPASDPTAANQAARKAYVDLHVLKSLFDATTFLYATSDNTPQAKTPAQVMAILSGQAAADFSLNTHKLTGVVNPTANQHAATKKYVDDQNGKKALIIVEIDGAGSAITTGVKADLRIKGYGLTFKSWTLLADQSGSIVIDIWKDTYTNYPPTNTDAMPGSGKEPTISGATKAEDTDLTDWASYTVSDGNCLRWNVDSCATIERVTLIIEAWKT